MIIVGVDPGITGAFAFYSTTLRRMVRSFSMPTLTLAKGKGSKHEISWLVVYRYIEQTLGGDTEVDYAFVERVQSSPQMGVTSAFNFGRSYGGLESLVAALKWPVEYVTPAKWKKALAVPADKDDAINRANQLMPLDVHHWTPMRSIMNKVEASGRAEAALIAYYGSETIKQRSPRASGRIPRRVLSEAS